MRKTTRTECCTLCSNEVPRSVTFRVHAELAGYEKFYACCLGGASNGYLDDSDDIFSISTALKRNDDCIDRMLLEDIGHLRLVGVVDGSSFNCGGNVLELGCVSR